VRHANKTIKTAHNKKYETTAYTDVVVMVWRVQKCGRKRYEIVIRQQRKLNLQLGYKAKYMAAGRD